MPEMHADGGWPLALIVIALCVVGTVLLYSRISQKRAAGGEPKAAAEPEPKEEEKKKEKKKDGPSRFWKVFDTIPWGFLIKAGVAALLIWFLFGYLDVKEKVAWKPIRVVRVETPTAAPAAYEPKTAQSIAERCSAAMSSPDPLRFDSDGKSRPYLPPEYCLVTMSSMPDPDLYCFKCWDRNGNKLRDCNGTYARLQVEKLTPDAPDNPGITVMYEPSV